MIKNISAGYTSGIDVRKYYPQPRFEGDDLTEGRKALEKSYTQLGALRNTRLATILYFLNTLKRCNLIGKFSPFSAQIG